MANNIENPVRKFVGNFRPLSNRFRCFFAFTTIQRSLLSNGVKTFRPIYKRVGRSSQLFLMFCLLFAVSTNLLSVSSAATYFVDFENGDDSATGSSPASAWNHAPGDPDATANPASITLQPGDTVLFKGGITYRGGFGLNAAGTAGSPIIYKGDGWPGLEGVKAIIDGSEVVTGWTKCESQDACGGNLNWQNIYYSYAPGEAEALSSNLYQDEEPLAISQHPNPVDPFAVEIRSTYLKVPLSDVTRTTLKDSRLSDFGKENLIGSYIAIHAYGTDVVYKKITDYDPVTDTITFEDLGKDPSADPCSYSILNSMDSNVLDTIGEYFFNETPESDGTHKVYIWPLSDPSSSEITVSVRNGFYTNRNYISIEGFKLQKFVMHALQTSSKPGKGLTFRNNEVSKIRAASKTNAVYISSVDDVVIENNYVHHTSNARGIAISGGNILAKNNIFTKVGGTVLDVTGGDGNRIIGNYIYDCRGAHANGISTYGGPKNLLVANNIVLNTLRPYTLNSTTADRPVENVTIYNNIFDGGNSADLVVAKWADASAGTIIFANNVVIGSPADGALKLYGGNATYIVKNNIIDGGSAHTSHNIFTGLSWSQTEGQGWSPGPGSIVDVGSDGEYDEVDMSTIFANMPAYEAQIYAVINESTFYLYFEEWSDRVGVGDIIEYNQDGIARTVESKEGIQDANYSSNRWFTKITFNPSVEMQENAVISIWKNNTNFTRDLRLKPDSIAIDAGTDMAPYLADAIQRFPEYDFYTDIEGNPRPQGASFDIGCYEHISSDPNNPTPELQAIGDKSVDENVTLIFTVNATDPNGEPITYSAQGLPSGATLDPQTGEFAWTPSYNQAGSYQVTFRASDGNSWDSETITITVNNVNRAPVLGAITDQSVNENALLSISVNATDPDGQALTYSVSGLPAGAVFVSQTLTWTPSYDQAGTFGVTFTADDGQAQDSQAITITVINVNRAPVFTAIDNKSVWADDPLTFTIDATDPDGDAVTYSAGALPTGATFTGQDFDWTPSQGQGGSYDVTFIASDGPLQDSQMVTITVDVDSLAPIISNSLPTAGSIQAPLNNLINLNITDAGKGIDADSVTIKVNNNTVYTGDTNHYSSPDGECRRLGNKADYRFVYQSNVEFDYDQTMGITVRATDLAGNAMSEHSYSFVTEMRSFGQNKQVSSGTVYLNSDRPVTVRDSSGDIWAAWHAGPIGNRDIYIGKLTAGADDFGSTVQLTTDATDQCNPAVALDSSDTLYVVWQDNREGDWDIYVSTSVDGTIWSTETRVNDPNNDNQVNPAIVIDGQSPNQAHVVWQDDRAGNQDICVATSSNGFTTKTVSQITSDTSDQVEPAISADSADTIYVVWMDGRNGPNDIYGAASNNGPWTNVAIVNNANNQSSPAIAAEGAGSILHLLWSDDTLGDNDIHYATSNGLLDCPLTGFSIIDDTSGADQLEPAIVVEGSTGNDLKVFACWQDWRNTDTDLYFAELSAGSGTNVFVGDGGSSAYQGEPVIGIDEYSHPYLVWADSRNTDIYYAGSTFVEPVPLISQLAPFSKGAVYGLPVGQLSNPGDICIQVPPGAYSHEMRLEASRIKNAHRFTSRQSKVPYEFSPSGIEFNVPITITIAYEPVGSAVSVYWHDPMTGTLKQDGITNVTIIEKSPTLHLVRFKVRHFTAFYLIGGGAAAALGGGGGGGCSVCSRGEGNMVEFALPYIGLAVVMAILKVRDSRRRKAHIA